MNWPFIIFFGIAVIALIIFLVIRNRKDEKIFEDQVNNDFPISQDEKRDDEIDKLVK
jgi:hypothetical protein